MSEILYNLLVVDDDERIRNLLSQYLIKEALLYLLQMVQILPEKNSIN